MPDTYRQMTEAEAQAAYDLVLRNELSGATRAVRDFEIRWRRWIGARHALATMNGSSALYSAFFGLGVGPGDEVLCPSYTWINTIGPALLLGARPVFCESDPETLLLDPGDVLRRITPRTRAMVAVHLWGNVCDMDTLVAIGRDKGIPVVEDCSHATGATWKGVPVGRLGSVGCWSFQSSKPVSAGEGGMLTTDDPEIFRRACLVSQCSSTGGDAAGLQPWGLGMKLRPHAVGIAIANIQLDRLPELNRRRAAWVEAIEQGLADVPGLHPIKIYPGAQRAGFHGFPILHDGKDVSTPAMIEALNAAGIAATPSGYPLLHRLPLFAKGCDLFTRNRGPLGADYAGYREGDLPRTENMHKRLIFLPLPDDATPNDAQKIIAELHRCSVRQA